MHQLGNSISSGDSDVYRCEMLLEIELPSDGVDRDSGGESRRRTRAGRDILSLSLLI